jgi:predicted transcriptional regulator
VKVGPEQLRAARALLNWPTREIAHRAGVAHGTVARLEQQPGPVVDARVSTLEAILDAYRAAGIRFEERDGAVFVGLAAPGRVRR